MQPAAAKHEWSTDHVYANFTEIQEALMIAAGREAEGHVLAAEWRELAERAESAAERAAALGYGTAARSRHLRAATYYTTAVIAAGRIETAKETVGLLLLARRRCVEVAFWC